MGLGQGTSWFRVPAVLTLGVCLAAGCQTRPSQPLAPPRATVTVEQFQGTAISGPQPTAVAPMRPEDALSVNVTLIALDQVPADSLAPLGARAKLIAVTQGALPVQPSATLTSAARLGLAEEASAFRDTLAAKGSTEAVELQRSSRALLPGSTVVFATDEPATPSARRVAVAVSLPAEPVAERPVRLALLVEDAVAPPTPPSDDAGEPASGTPAATPPLFRRETVVVDDLALGQGLQAALVAPFRFTDSRARAMAFLIQVNGGSNDESHTRAVARAVAELTRSADLAAKRPAVGPLQIDRHSGLLGAVARLSDPGTRRAALVYLAGQTDASFCGDVALVADELVLKALADRLMSTFTAASSSPTDPASLGWMLDVAALQMLSELANIGTLPPEMSTVLTLHAGEAGRHPASLKQVCRDVDSRQVLQNRLIAENMIYLEDNSPASRVRAYDWLRGIGSAPADYQPLGNPKQRRQALDRALSLGSSPTTQQVQP
jgi:hypothetical protein